MDEITKFIILIFVGIIGGMIAKRLKQPVIIGYILGSALFSNIFQMHHEPDGLINILAQIGVTLLLFTMGIEFSLDKLLAVKKYALIGGVLQIVLTIIMGLVIFPLFKFDTYQSLFLGAVFSMSSTAVVVRILEELDIIDSTSSEITLGWLVLQDIAVVFIIIMLGSLSSSKVGSTDILTSLIKSFVLIASSLVIGRKVLPRILTSIASLGSKELVILSAFGFCLLFAFIAEKLGVSSTLGAFLAGLMISESILNHEIITEINPLQSIFSMLFFVTIGSLFSFPLLIANLGTILLVLGLTMLLKVIIVLFLGLVLKLHVKTALEVSLNLAQIGEFAFLSAQIGLANKWIDPSLNSTIIAVTVLSLIITPFLIINSEKIYKRLGELVKKIAPQLYRKLFTSTIADLELGNAKPQNHVIILGYGRVGKYLGLALKKMRRKFVVVELNNLAEIEADIGGTGLIVGDATNTEILMAAGIENAKICIITLPKEADVGEVIRIAKGINPDIQLIIRKHHDSLIFNDEDVFAVIEPEFEATLKMLEKLMSIYKKKDRKIIDWVKSQKKTLH